MDKVYARLAKHLEGLLLGYPNSEPLLDLLAASFTPFEAQVALGVPNDLSPFQVVSAQTVAQRCGLDGQTVRETLASLAERGLLYTAPLPPGDEEQGYALLQIGYGMPQTFFWAGPTDDEPARRMARLVLDYFTVETTRQVYGGVPTKAFRYAPGDLRVEVPLQGVFPGEMIEPVVAAAGKIAVAHCPCRTSARILGRTDCDHSLEVCLKYDEMAEFVLDHGLARPVSRDEALSILKKSEEEGLVHMVDNAAGEIKHTCNCCGHYCWNVGIIRRRKIPRDVLMAVYFIRETDSEACLGCGACADICPVEAVAVENEKAVVDKDWCIGCGVCAGVCPAEAVSLSHRTEARPPETVTELHGRIRRERGLG